MLHIEIKGHGSPLVLLHGWGMHSGIFHPLIESLGQHHELYLVDIPGFGHSHRMAFNLDDFFKELSYSLPNRFALLGWSLGGLIATSYALAQPARVSCLINVCSAPKFIASESWPGVHDSIFEKFSQQLKKDFKQTISDFLQLQLTRQQRHHYNSLKELLFALPPKPQALACGLSLLQEKDVRPWLHELSMPTWYVYGRLDKLIPLEQMQVLQKSHPHFAYSVFAKAGHLPFLSHQQEFEHQLLEFLQ